MWIQNPNTGEAINFDEVYSIQVHKYTGSDGSQLVIELYFFSKEELVSDSNYLIHENKTEFFRGDLQVGEHLLEWLSGKLGILKFHAIEVPPVEVVIDEASMKACVDDVLRHLKELKSLLPEDTYLNPFLQDFMDASETVDYIIERSNYTFSTEIHKSWKLRYEETVAIAQGLETLVKAVKLLGFAPKLTKYQKEALRGILGDDEQEEK